MWSGSLRYFFMLPFLFVLVGLRGNLKPILQELRHHPQNWLIWSTVGFGLFYAPLCFAAAYGPGWLIAATWQLTIVCGALLSPLFSVTIQTENGPVVLRERIPVRGLALSVIILIGIALMQLSQVGQAPLTSISFSVLAILIAAISYPLGNRKMMAYTGRRWDTFQRLLGMTLASCPFWLLLSGFALVTAGPPPIDQIIQSIIVAVSSGVIATVLFFYATELVKEDSGKLAAVEATQSMEVVFTLLGELIFFGGSLPTHSAWIGLLLVIGGMILHSSLSQSRSPLRNRTAESNASE
ncbi:multidrug resistance efflux transporter family protein [Sporolactobacillus spathodeae]